MPRRIYPDVLAAVGKTPMLALRRLVLPEHARVLVKCEFANPHHSVKDRAALAMVDAAEAAGSLRPGGHIIEPSSGNTGISLAFIAAVRGYRLTVVLPESMSGERRRLLAGLGAEVVLTPGCDMRTAVDVALALHARTSGSWMPRQFENPANPRAHELTTGPEIWEDTDGEVDIFVAGVGTGGTITGVTRYLRGQRPEIEAVAVEPEACPLLSRGRVGSHRIQGIGAGFIPPILDRAAISEVAVVSDEEATAWARRLARDEGIFCGISTGANITVARRLAARRENRGKTIVTVACSFGERYLSTPLFDVGAGDGGEVARDLGCGRSRALGPSS
ncbi:MAG: cysteine synthase A [Nannocystaceae bacterium]